MRRVELREQLGLALEAKEAVGIEREVFGKDLDRDVAVQARVAGTIDDSHRAGSERADDLVAANPCPGYQHEACSTPAVIVRDYKCVGETNGARMGNEGVSVTKPKPRASNTTGTERRQKKASKPARQDPPQADIPPSDGQVPEGPDNLRARAAAFKRRHGVKS